MKLLLRLSACLVPLCLLPMFASAASTDADFRPLLKERKTAEAQKLAEERFGKDSKDDVALWYWARLVAGDAKQRDELMPKAEQCIKDLPQSARCHHALGTLYGAAAMSSGLMNGLKYASRIKELFIKAVELDPANFDARRDLSQYYLQAPGIAGGSVRKAIENADAHGKLNKAEGQLLRVEVHIYEKEYDKAETMLAAIKPAPADEAMTNAVTQAWTNLGFAMIGDKQPKLAQTLFEKLLTMHMNTAAFHFGLGRAHLENNAIDAAIAAFERALSLDGKLTAHYRLGIAYQSKGDKPKAIAAFQQFLTYSQTGKAADDARQRLDALKKTI